MKHAVFRAYADATISRGRFLASLGNDLHRYYRTLCMDYRHKVDELDKSWAIRVLKLRHSRKLWHLANLALQCWSYDAIGDDGDDADRDVTLAARIGWPSLLRLAGALDHFGAPELGRAIGELARKLSKEDVGAARKRLESEHGLPFISVSQPTDSNPAGRMMRRSSASQSRWLDSERCEKTDTA